MTLVTDPQEIGQDERVALVTGGARRVGRAIVERLSAAGFSVGFTYHTSVEEARTLLATLRDRGTRAETFAADLADPRIMPALATRLLAAFSRVDLVVHNASIYLPDSTLLPDGGPPDLTGLRRMWAVHVESPLLLTHALADTLRRSRGSVVTFVDAQIDRPMPAYAGYVATKAALANLTKSLARQLAPDVTVNAIAPGVIEWPDDFPQAQKDAYLSRVPLARAGTPADAAEAVLYLATVGKYMTGQTLTLDGGRSLR